MFQIGERVRVRTEDKSQKAWGRVVNVASSTEMVDVTMGPEAAKLGLRPDVSRTYAPGHTSVRIEIELET